eukprot:766605-Hanusia_phi.AAC.20
MQERWLREDSRRFICNALRHATGSYSLHTRRSFREIIEDVMQLCHFQSVHRACQDDLSSSPVDDLTCERWSCLRSDSRSNSPWSSLVTELQCFGFPTTVTASEQLSADSVGLYLKQCLSCYFYTAKSQMLHPSVSNDQKHLAVLNRSVTRRALQDMPSPPGLSPDRLHHRK